MTPEVVGTNDHQFFVGEIVGDVMPSTHVKIMHPMVINLVPDGPASIKISMSMYPPGVNYMLDDISEFTIRIPNDQIRFRGRASDSMAQEWKVASNKFRNIAIPTTGQIIDVERTAK